MRADMICKRCGSVLSAVTFECARGAHRKAPSTMATMFPSEEIRTWALGRVSDAENRRKWSDLPSDFEAAAVARVFVEIKPHMDRKAIRQRIAAAKACTFAELRDAIG